MEDIRVLLVDPDEAGRHFLAKMLLKKKYQVLHAGSGHQGVELAGQAFPSIIVFDPSLPDLNAREFLHEIKQNLRTAQIPCVALSSQSNPEEMQMCLQAGCIEYYVKSGMIMINLVEAIPKLILESKRHSKASQDGMLVVFLSAKGGTGTSSLCANVAVSMAQHIQSAAVALVDLVLPMGSIAQIVGCDQDAFNLVTASNDIKEDASPEYFEARLVEAPHWPFDLLPGSPDPEAANQLDVKKIPGIISALRKKHDYVLVDIGRMLSRISLPIIKTADLVVLVLSTDMSTVTLTKTLWEYLEGQGVAPNRVFAILNRAVGLEGLTKMEAEKILGINIKLMMPYMMGNFTLANNLHMPIITKFPTDTASMVMKQAALDMSYQAIKVREQPAG